MKSLLSPQEGQCLGTGCRFCPVVASVSLPFTVSVSCLALPQVRGQLVVPSSSRGAGKQDPTEQHVDAAFRLHISL